MLPRHLTSCGRGRCGRAQQMAPALAAATPQRRRPRPGQSEGLPARPWRSFAVPSALVVVRGLPGG